MVAGYEMSRVCDVVPLLDVDSVVLLPDSTIKWNTAQVNFWLRCQSNVEFST